MIPDRVAALLWAAFLRNRNVDARTAVDGAIPVAGGYAIYVEGTAYDYALGAGLTRPLRDDDLAAVEEFYAARAHPARLELDEQVLARDGELLAARGYAAEAERFAILEGPLDGAARDVAPDGISVRQTRDRRAWVELAARGFADGAIEPGLLRRTLHIQAAAAHVLFIAAADGKDVATAALTVYGDLALLSSASVLPPVRARGIHRALVAARLADARGRGAKRAALKTPAESPVERSAAHFGIVRTGLRRRITRSGV